jgi:hypothetical protein
MIINAYHTPLHYLMALFLALYDQRNGLEQMSNEE